MRISKQIDYTTRPSHKKGLAISIEQDKENVYRYIMTTTLFWKNRNSIFSEINVHRLTDYPAAVPFFIYQTVRITFNYHHVIKHLNFENKVASCGNTSNLLWTFLSTSVTYRDFKLFIVLLLITLFIHF